MLRTTVISYVFSKVHHTVQDPTSRAASSTNMSAFFRGFRSKPTTPAEHPSIDYGVIQVTLARIEADMKNLRISNHQPYHDMLAKAQCCSLSECPKHIQKLLEDNRTMEAIFARLQDAADVTKATNADKLTLMIWQVRYLSEKCRIEKIRSNI